MPGSEILEKVKAEGRSVLMEHEAKLFLAQNGIPVVKTEIASTEKEAVSLAKKIGYPVVLKIASPDITHKSDIGGVILNIDSDKQVEAAYGSLLARVKDAKRSAGILGVAVEEMVKSSVEVAIGLTRDKQFGPVIMFGVGGILIEILKDVVFRVCPITQNQALEMMSEIKGYPILKGYRGLPPADLDGLAFIISKISELSLEYPEIETADLNPLMVHGSEITVADARIMLSK